MKKFFIFPLILPFLLSGCKDKDGEQASKETIVKGHVLDKGSKARVSFAKIVLIEVTTEGLFGRSEKVLKTIETDSSGYYELKVDHPDASKDYLCYAEESLAHYLDYGIEAQKSIKPGVSNHFEHHLVSFAWFRVKIVNIQPYNHLDRLSVNGPIDAFTLGGAIDSTIVVKAQGNMENSFHLFITKNEVMTKRSLHFYVQAFDTTDILIEY